MNKFTGVSSWRFIILIISLFALFSCSNLTVPDALEGTYFGNNRIVARYHKEGQYIFYEDNVAVIIYISKNQQVTGNIGEAAFEECKIYKNRGWLGRKLNLKTDFIISGKLKGTAFGRDSLENKDISIPFNIENGQVKGSLFLTNKGQNYPMISHLILQKK